MNEDESHLNLLKILHYVHGGLLLLASLFGAIYIIFGVLFLSVPELSQARPGNPPPPEGMPEIMGGVFIGVGVIIMIIIIGYAVLQFLAARAIGQRKWWVFVFVISCFNCMNVPLGTALGVFTILVLLRDSVKNSFGQNFQ